jgi:hypothetical protein
MVKVPVVMRDVVAAVLRHAEVREKLTAKSSHRHGRHNRRIPVNQEASECDRHKHNFVHVVSKMSEKKRIFRLTEITG